MSVCGARGRLKRSQNTNSSSSSLVLFHLAFFCGCADMWAIINCVYLINFVSPLCVARTKRAKSLRPSRPSRARAQEFKSLVIISVVCSTTKQTNSRLVLRAGRSKWTALDFTHPELAFSLSPSAQDKTTRERRKMATALFSSGAENSWNWGPRARCRG